MTDHADRRLSDLIDDLNGVRTSAALSKDTLPDPAILVLDSTLSPESLSVAEVTNRRAFLTRASALSLAIPGIGAALAACTTEGVGGRDSTQARGRSDSASAGAGMQHHNSDSRLDTAMLKDAPHVGTTSSAAATQGAGSATFQRYDPSLPPLPTGDRIQLHWHARDAAVRITSDTVVAAWTFEGNVPGPIVHCRVGQTVEFTLTNDVAVPHSMDFHAAQVNPKAAFRSVTKGESVTFTFTPK